MFGLPAMAALIVLAKPIIMLLFMRGAFSQNDVMMVSYSLMAYATGLVSFMLIKVLAPGFYARQDIKTPVRIGIIAMVTNMGLNLLLAPWLSYVGLALATALSASLNAFLLYRGLALAGVFCFSKSSGYFLAKIALASVLMASGLYWFSPPFVVWLALDFWAQAGRLALLCLLGIVSYFLMLWLLGVRLSHFRMQTVAESN
jgi:putative peptidoglycan lipid II flippase